MTDINKLIETTELLLAAATPGLYIVELDTYTDTWTVSIPGLSIAEELNEPDAYLFAAAPETLRALIDEVKRLHKRNEELYETLQIAEDYGVDEGLFDEEERMTERGDSPMTDAGRESVEMAQKSES